MNETNFGHHFFGTKNYLGSNLDLKQKSLFKKKISLSVSCARSTSNNLFSTLSPKSHFLHKATLWNLSPAFA